jgi:hypothetical protein
MYEKPEWFDLKNYDELKSFNLFDWFTQLEYRHNINLFLSEQDSLDDDKKKFLEEGLIALRGGIVKKHPPFSLHDLKITERPSVSDLSVEDITSCFDFVLLEMPDKLDSSESFDILREPITDGANTWEANIRVDLDASEEQIRKDFEIWLKARKKPDNIYKNLTNFKKTHLSDWVDQRLLPFIDLHLHYKAYGWRPKIEKFGQWLFPETSKYRDRNNLEKTILKKSEWLLETSTILKILSQLRNC